MACASAACVIRPVGMFTGSSRLPAVRQQVVNAAVELRGQAQNPAFCLQAPQCTMVKTAFANGDLREKCERRQSMISHAKINRD